MIIMAWPLMAGWYEMGYIALGWWFGVLTLMILKFTWEVVKRVIVITKEDGCTS